MSTPRRAIGSIQKYHDIQADHAAQIRDNVETAISEAIAKWGENINCFTLHLELKRAFPGANMWGSEDHVLTEIDGLMFDAKGLQFTRCILNDPSQIKKCFNRWPKVNDF